MDLLYIDKPLFQRMFGVAVREAREAFQIDTAELSEITGISQNRLQQIEKGQRWVSKSARAILISKLAISEARLEKMVAIARLGFIDSFNEEVKLLSLEF